MQGDTGPVNFMFDGDRVSAIIDLEWAHLGDPLEDIGNICVREFWNPSGGLDGLFHLYEAESGIPYERFAAQYYRVQQNVRGMIPIHFITENAHPRESLAWYLCYRYVGDRSTCESIAEAAGITVERPELPADDDGERDIVAAAAVCSLERDVRPKLDRRLRHLAGQGRRDAHPDHGPPPPLRRRPSTPSSATSWPRCSAPGPPPGPRARGCSTRPSAPGSVDDAAVITYLTRRAYRDEWLYEPAVSLYPERTWSALDD